ncbi:hypothetical protein GQ44DRAFT_817933 [Phaeosphaeriaceae sp. PMI808]|nr:hypothetical protein GQ44DRAFT_817933 [Phaeosphaeriaceae sp. PMI808]
MSFPNVPITFAGVGNTEHPETPPLPACFVPFGRDPDFVDRATLLDQIREKCSVPASRVALVGLGVLDNADDAGVFQSSAEENGSSDSRSAFKQRLSKYLPLTKHGSVLVTSRTKRAAMQLVEDSDIIPIEPMDDAAAHALLRTKLGDKVDSDGGIAELAATLDFIPLALVQAAAYIRERAPRCTMRQYLNEYHQSDSRRTSLLNHSAGYLRRDKTASNSVLLTWQISFDHIHSTKRSATDLLSLMSFFDRQGIQEAVLRRSSATTDNDGFEDDILTLRDFSFITVTRDATTFEMYSLVQLATRKWLENQGQLGKWREQFISNLCAEMPKGQYENWEKCQALYPHVRAALVQRPKDKESLEKWALLLYNASWYVWQRGRASEAEEIATVSVDVRREVLGEEHADTLESMSIVGLARELGGKYEEAEAMHRQTLALSKKVLGRKHPNTLASIDNLAIALRSQGKYKEAEAMHRQTLALREKVLGREHPDTLASMDNLAIVVRS